MEATNRFFSGFGATRARLAILAATFVAAMVGVVTPAQAALTGLTVGPQSGTLNAGTAGTATYTVTLTRSGFTPSNVATVTWTISGLPSGATASVGPANGNWSGILGGGQRSYPLTVNTTTATPGGTATFTVQASASGTQSGTGTLTVNPAVVAQPQTITFGALAGKTFGDAPFNVSATASSGLTVSFAAAGNCGVAGTLVSVTGAGSCTITASQAGNANWLAATPVAQTFPIAKANQTITFNALADKLVGDPAFTVSATSTSTLAVTFGATGDCTVAGSTVSLTTPATLPGNCTITASQAGNANFNAAASVPQTFAINAFTGTELYAVAGSTGLPVPGSTTPMAVPVWGYNSSAAGVSKPGGPTLFVDQGATVTIRLHNNLAETTALLIQGQTMIPDTTGVAPGQTKVYTFTASQPGTFLYEAGLLPRAQHQVAMGLYGALVVRPTGAPLQAYAAASTAFDDEAVLVLGEIDPILNFGPTTFDMRDFKPTHFLINGDVYPNTAPIASAPGRKVLLRYVNGGAKHHSMAALGARQVVVGEDGSALAHARTVVAKTIAPGQTADAIVTVPAAALAGQKFAVYDGNLMLHNGGADNAFGGMLTFVSVSGTPPTGDTTGPVSSGLAYAAGTLTATVSDANTGGSTVAAAEYFVDVPGTAGTGTAMAAADGAFDGVSENVTATVAVAPGTHTLYLRGRDAAGNWGAVTAKVVNGGDTLGPITSALVLSPSTTDGTVDVSLTGTANDTNTGGSNIAAAEYFIGTVGSAGTGTPMSFAPANAKIASLTGAIPMATVNALAAGNHVVSVRSKDSEGNWGTAVATTLVVNKNAATTGNVVVTFTPNNGARPLNASQPVVRVTASVTGAGVNAAEGFFCLNADPCTAGADGTGFPFLPADGAWGGAIEPVTADIPLSTVGAMADGSHTIYVHGKAASGGWGTTSSAVLVVDRTAPTVSGLLLAPAASHNSAVVISATAADASAIVAAEYFIDTVGAVGTGTPMTPGSSLSATIPGATIAGLSDGNHTLYVRAMDAATNWSAAVSAVLLVDHTAPTTSNLTVAAIAFGATSTSATVTAQDPAPGSGLNGGEYWIDGSAAPPATTIAFAGTSSPITIAGINLTGLASGPHILYVRVKDAVGNYSSVRSQTFSIPVDQIFADGFETGPLSGGTGNAGNWTSRSTGTESRVDFQTAAALFGSYGLQVQGNDTNYVQYNFGNAANPATSTFDARFYFNPHGFQPNAGGNVQDIFVAASNTNYSNTNTTFRVRYRVNGGQQQVQIQVGSGTANTAWANLVNNTSNRIEVVWQAGASLALYVNGAAAQSLATTSTNLVSTMRLGSVTDAGGNANTTYEYFDNFTAKRSVTSLIGP